MGTKYFQKSAISTFLQFVRVRVAHQPLVKKASFSQTLAELSTGKKDAVHEIAQKLHLHGAANSKICSPRPRKRPEFFDLGALCDRNVCTIASVQQQIHSVMRRF